MNGGMQRCFNIINQLAKHFELTAIIHQDKQAFLKAINDFPSVASAKIYSTKDSHPKDIFSLLPSKFQKALRYRWYKKQIYGSADGNFLSYYLILKHLLRTQKFDVVILENLATLNAISVIRKYDKQVKIIYDAHNVDTNLAKAALAKKEVNPKRLKEICKAETTLHKEVNALFTCSDDDKKEFLKLNKEKLPVKVVPNGVNIPEQSFNEAVKKEYPSYILFCGSLWSLPNAEGLFWFVKKIWPLVLDEFPNLKLLVVGSGDLPGKYSEIGQTESIEFSGPVEDVKEWYNKATISVVPLLTGSGTRLKILEAMGIGVPVVSTSIGAEGIKYSDNSDILIADKEELFAEKVIYFLKNKEIRLDTQKKAKELVKKNYDWNIVGDSMAEFIRNHTNDKKTLKINFGYFWPEFDNYDNYFTRLLSRRYNVIVSDDPDFYIFTHPYYNNKKDYENYKCHRIFFGFENVRANWNICDYVVDSDYTNHPRHKRRPLWAGFIAKELTLPKDLQEFKEKKKFCCMLVSNPNAKERIDFFYKLSKYKKVDSAGRYLNNISYSVGNKKEFIKDYKFVISFENSSYPGYTTEKLIEPMLVNSIPIYWGNPRVGEDFNTKSFININDFKSFDDAIQYIIELDNNDEKYLELAAQPWFNENKIAKEYSEESVLDFFDFIVEDSKKRKPVAKSHSNKYLRIKSRFKL